MLSADLISDSRDFTQYLTSGVLRARLFNSDFDSFSRRVHLSYGVCRLRARVQLKPSPAPLNKSTFCRYLFKNQTKDFWE